MALVKCYECKGAVSSAAEVCPQCGAPFSRKTSVFVQTLAALLVAALVIGGVLWGIVAFVEDRRETERVNAKVRDALNWHP